MGSGTGIFSVLAALGGASRVVAIDINDDAVSNTMENARLHHVDGKLKALHGDMFAPLATTERFDVIFFNIPFCHRPSSKVNTMLARSLLDPEHDLLHRYLKDGKKYLNSDGRMLLGYSTTHGDVPLMYRLAKQHGCEVKLLSKDGNESKDFITVELYEFRIRA